MIANSPSSPPPPRSHLASSVETPRWDDFLPAAPNLGPPSSSSASPHQPSPLPPHLLCRDAAMGRLPARRAPARHHPTGFTIKETR
jgi:hypothetical protein